MASIQKRSGRWYARHRGPDGREHARRFGRKIDAQRWLDEATTAIVTGQYVDPKTARTTVSDWCAVWLDGYGTRRPSTVRQAKVHLARIVEAFGPMPLAAVRPSHVRAWTAKLRDEGCAESYVYALHGRLSQLFSDAVHDGIVSRSPCSRRTSPGTAKQRAYVATTEQVWALHDAVSPRYRAGILLGAFAGLRVAEACGLRVGDVDFMRGVIHPAVQFPAEPLKTDISKTSVPIPRSLAAELSAHVAAWPGDTLLTNGEHGGQLGPWVLERVVRTARSAHVDPLPDKHPDDCAGCLVPGLPRGFRFHDLRHYFASLLIASGADVKVVQARLRHASAKTTLDCYGHLWPDSDQSTRAAVDAVLAARAGTVRAAGTAE